ncbi:hypothetical protein ABZ990_27380 [Streptomyces sp. NPDC046203]|uniref:hypothetical protein n=1 Tax=Streptomyces sp. NPDC046203 TaxID=3154602 RepID=UPI0033EEDCF4
MNTQTEPEWPPRDTNPAGPPIRLLFREVVADRLTGAMPPQAAMLFAAETDPSWDDRSFLGDFYGEILHQDTCRPDTADGLALLAALAAGDRIPARHRFQAVALLFKAATVAERHLAESGPGAPQHTDPDSDPDSEARARGAVRARVPGLLARWPAECPAVRLALAGLAVVFPTDRTLPALTPRLRAFAHRYPRGTDIGDYVRFVLVLAARDDVRTLAVTEELTGAHWPGTPRGVPTRARALHLLDQMLTRVGAGLARSPAGR